MSNRLINETSPYLLQHADNPVDWYPWGEEAFDEAAPEDKPIFLSVGYSACHWCHVMEHESFEDAATAALHERALRLDQGRSRGAARRRRDLHGRRAGADRARRLADERLPHAGRRAVLRRHVLPRQGPLRDAVVHARCCTQIAELWETRPRRTVEAGGARLEPHARSCGRRVRCRTPPARAAARAEQRWTIAVRRLSSRAFDRANGGWGGAPKFPQPAVVEFVLRRHLATGRRAPARDGHAHARRDDARRHLRPARRRLPPLRDGRALAGAALREDALRQRAARPALPARLAGHRRRRRTGASSTETLDYVAREMRDASGGFYSAQDADSEGDEGALLRLDARARSRPSLERVGRDAGGDAELFMARVRGDAEAATSRAGTSCIVARTAAEIARRPRHCRRRGRGAPRATARGAVRGARAARQARTRRQGARELERPHARRRSPRPRACSAATTTATSPRRNAEFLLAQMRDDRRPHAAHLEGRARQAQRLPRGLRARRRRAARALPDDLRRRAGSRPPASSPTSILDALRRSEPAASSTRATTTRRCSCGPRASRTAPSPREARWRRASCCASRAYTGEGRYADAARGRAGADAAAAMARAPLGFAHWLGVLDFMLAPPQELAIVGEDPQRAARGRAARYRPNLVVAAGHRRCRRRHRPARRPRGHRRRARHGLRLPAVHLRARRSPAGRSSQLVLQWTGRRAARARYAVLVGHDAGRVEPPAVASPSRRTSRRISGLAQGGRRSRRPVLDADVTRHSRSSHPVRDQQALNPAEVADVVADQRRAPAAGVGGDQHVHGAERRAALLQRRPDGAVVFRGRLVPRQDTSSRDTRSPISRRMAAAAGWRAAPKRSSASTTVETAKAPGPTSSKRAFTDGGRRRRM